MPRLLLLAALLAAPSLPLLAQIDSSITWVQGGPYRLKAAVYRASSQEASTLVVILHGDAPFAKPDYQDRFAASVARTYPSVVASAILRPGYTDPAGHTSEGVRGETTGDNYNAGNTDALAAAIIALRSQLSADRVVLVGHSGGAALAANILGRHPSLATAALLVSCPCDVTAWRRHMFARTKFAGFQTPVPTVSPIDLVDSLPPAVKIVMLVGAQDDVTPPALTEAYAAKARARGLAVQVEALSGEGHEILLKPRVLESVRSVLH